MKWFIGVALAIAVPLVVYYYVTRKRPDLVYIVSEPVALPSTGHGPQIYAQQLELRNVGKALARGITLKVDAKIDAPEVVPFSKADKYSLFPSESALELQYASLPPSAGMKLLFRTAAPGIDESDIQVTHGDGPGRNALSGRSSHWSTAVALAILYCGFFGWMFRASAVERLQGRTRWDSKRVLMQSRPFYVTSKSWLDLQDEAAKCFIEARGLEFRSIQDMPSFWPLSQDMPATLSPESWRQLQSMARKKLSDDVHSLAVSYVGWSPDDIAALIEGEKPQYLPESAWEKIVDDVSKLYVLSIRENTWGTDDCKREALREHPNAIRREELNKLQKDLRERYLSDVVSRMLDALDPLAYVDKMDLDWLGEKQAATLQKRGRRLDESYHYAAALGTLRLVIRGGVLVDEKPPGVSSKDWSELTSLWAQVVRIRESKGEATHVAEERAEVERLKRQLTRQLAIIHGVLSDPDSIDRIEQHDNPFASGNFANLRRIAEILRDENVGSAD